MSATDGYIIKVIGIACIMMMFGADGHIIKI